MSSLIPELRDLLDEIIEKQVTLYDHLESRLDDIEEKLRSIELYVDNISLECPHGDFNDDLSEITGTLKDIDNIIYWNKPFVQ